MSARCWSLAALPGKTVHHPRQAVAEVRHVEVDQESDRTTAHSQVGQQLRFVHRCRPCNCLDFNDHPVIDDDIHSIPGIDRATSVSDRKGYFRRMGNAPQSKFVTKADTICTFEQARTE